MAAAVPGLGIEACPLIFATAIPFFGFAYARVKDNELKAERAAAAGLAPATLAGATSSSQVSTTLAEDIGSKRAKPNKSLQFMLALVHGT